MKAILALLALSGLISTAFAACSSSTCTGATSLDCTVRNTYYNCLVTESAGCTSSQTSEKAVLDATAAAELIAKAALGCGAGSITVSITTVLLSVIAVFLKM